MPKQSGVSYAPQQPSQVAPSGADPNLSMSDSLRQALDPNSPGYSPSAQGQGQQGGPIFGQPGQQAQQPGQQAQPQQAQTPAEFAYFRQQLQRYGVNVPENITPEQAFMTVAQAINNRGQQDMYAQLGQAVAPEWDAYNQWRQQQQAAQQAPQQDELWNPPQFNPEWMNMVETDPQTGRIRSKFGYDSRYGTMAQSYADYMEAQQRELWQNPQQYMWKMVEPLVKQAMQGDRAAVVRTVPRASQGQHDPRPEQGLAVPEGQ
jgi:hypothetical protein